MYICLRVCTYLRIYWVHWWGCLCYHRISMQMYEYVPVCVRTYMHICSWVQRWWFRHYTISLQTYEYTCVCRCVCVYLYIHANMQTYCAQFLQGYEWRSCVRGRGRGGEVGRGWFGKERWGYICSCKKREGFVHVVASSVCRELVNGKLWNPLMMDVFEIVNLGWYNASFLKLSMSGVRAVRGPCSRR